MQRKNPLKCLKNVKLVLGLSHSDKLAKLYQQRYAENVLQRSASHDSAQAEEPCVLKIAVEDGFVIRSPKELAALILQRFHAEAKTHINLRPEASSLTVLSVPTWYESPQKTALYEAARQAGLVHVATIKEPLAAVKAYCLDEINALDENIIVLKLDHDLCEVSLVRQDFPGRPDIMSNRLSWELNGMVFIRKVLNYLFDQIKEQNNQSNFSPEEQQIIEK